MQLYIISFSISEGKLILGEMGWLGGSLMLYREPEPEPESYHLPGTCSFCWNSLLDSRMETAVRQLFWDRYDTGVSYPARPLFVLYTAKRPACERAVY